MKSLLLAILLAVSCGGMVMPARADNPVTFSYFYDSLAPYGEWVDVQNYGYCWHPRADADWQPYTDGYWSYTDAGWTWVSYEDFGSIVYHYGRWVRIEDFGWVWKPDYEWGPAWVSWRQSDDYIGWAPLPPDAAFDDETGLGVWVDRDYDIGPSVYVFCEYRYFGAPVIRNFIIPRHRNWFIINSTINITNIAIIGGHERHDRNRLIFNGGPDYRRIAERSEHPIATLQLVRQTEGDWAHHHRAEMTRQVGSQLIVAAPLISAPTARAQITPPTVARQIRAPKVDKGWTGVSDPAERQRIQQRYQDQTKGLTRASAPAVRVDAAQVQTVVDENRTIPGQTPRGSQRVQPPATPAQQPQIAQPQQAQPQGDHQRHGQAQPQPTAATPQTAATQPQIQQPQAQPVPSQGKNKRHGQPEPQAVTPAPQAPTAQPQIQQPQAQPQPAQTPQQQGGRQPKQQPKQDNADQQRNAAEAQARAAQQQAEQQRAAAEAKARAAQAEQAQREQQRAAEVQTRAQQQAEQQRATRQQADRQQQAAQVQAHRGQQAQTPAPADSDDKKKHKDQP